MSRTVLGVTREGGPVRTRLCRGGSRQWRSLRDQGRGGYSARTAALPSAPPGGLDWLSSRGPWLLPTRTRRSPRGRGLDLEPTAPLPSRCAETRTVPGPPCAGLSRLTTAQRLVFSLAKLGKPRLLPLKCGPPTPASIGVSGQPRLPFLGSRGARVNPGGPALSVLAARDKHLRPSSCFFTVSGFASVSIGRVAGYTRQLVF